jgi:hypothetical protein
MMQFTIAVPRLITLLLWFQDNAKESSAFDTITWVILLTEDVAPYWVILPTISPAAQARLDMGSSKESF